MHGYVYTWLDCDRASLSVNWYGIPILTKLSMLNICAKFLQIYGQTFFYVFNYANALSTGMSIYGQTVQYHYTKIIFVRSSVTGGQRKRFNPETQEAVSLAIERTKLELGDHCKR